MGGHTGILQVLRMVPQLGAGITGFVVMGVSAPMMPIGGIGIDIMAVKARAARIQAETEVILAEAAELRARNEAKLAGMPAEERAEMESLMAGLSLKF